MKNKPEKTLNRYQVMGRVAAGLVFAMTVTAIVFYNRMGIIEFPGLGEVYVTLAIAGLFVSSALFALITFDKRETGEDDFYFMQELFLLCASLFTDMATWYLYGNEELYIPNEISNGLVFVFGITSINCFYQYLIHTILRDRLEKLAVLTRIFHVVELLLLLAVFTNPFTHWVYSLDSEGIYVPHWMAYVVFVFFYAVCIALFVITYRSSIKREQKFSVYAFCFFSLIARPLTGGGSTELVYPLWITAIIWCFVVIYDKRRREMEMKKREIQIADAVLSGILPKDESKITPEIQELVDRHTVPAAMQAVEELTRMRVRK